MAVRGNPVSNRRKNEIDKKQLTSLSEQSVAPTVAFDQEPGNRSHDEATDSGSTQSDTSCQWPPLLEVVTDNDDRRHVDEAESYATKHTVEEMQVEHVRGKHAHGEGA